jgi:enoyl-CoA hydratase
MKPASERRSSGPAASPERRPARGSTARRRFETLVVSAPDGDGVAIVTLDRPERLNAMSAAMFADIAAVCAALDADPAVRAIVVTGAGRGFCAGLDLDEAIRLPAMTVPEMYDAQSQGALAIAGLHRIGKPAIAAVNGPAAGGGLALALACDVRIASEAARFGVAFVRLGLSGCDVGVSWLLPRIVGMGAAAELMLTGRVIDASEALRIGLVSRVVANDEVVAAAVAVARETARNSPFGLRLTKEGLRSAVDAPSLEAAIALENRNQVLASRTEDMAEAARAFVEKRPARFQGR